MIRFIDVSGQIIEGEQEFAFFDTITEKFCEFNGTHVWLAAHDFIEDYDDNEEDIERFLNKIPDKFR